MQCAIMSIVVFVCCTTKGADLYFGGVSMSIMKIIVPVAPMNCSQYADPVIYCLLGVSLQVMVSRAPL